VVLFRQGAMRLWFANLIMYSPGLTVARCYVLFTYAAAQIAPALCDDTAKISGGEAAQAASRQAHSARNGSLHPSSSSPKWLRRDAAGLVLFAVFFPVVDVSAPWVRSRGRPECASVSILPGRWQSLRPIPECQPTVRHLGEPISRDPEAPIRIGPITPKNGILTLGQSGRDKGG
jgi:hypothetical protein